MKSFAKKIFISIVLFLVCGESYSQIELGSIKDFKELRSEHFIIQYSSRVEQSYANEVKNMCESFYTKITQEFNLIRKELWLWENRAQVFIAADKDDYVTIFSCPDWSGACVDYESKKIYTYPNQNRFKPVLAHEMTHIILREYIGKDILPLWLDEAIAVYMEDRYGEGYYEKSIHLIKEYIRKDSYIKFSELMQINSDTLNSQPDENVELFYMEVFSIVHFLTKRYGRENFSYFLFFLKEGLSVEQALPKGFSALRSFDELESKWRQFYVFD